MRAAVVVGLLATRLANAQPAQVPPGTYNQPVVIPLSPEVTELLAKGEISTGAHLGGAAASLVVGFGVGHAIQGRWADDGWKFTIGEGVLAVGLVVGTVQGFDSGGDVPLLFIGSGLAFLGLRLWEIYDAIVEPPRHNDRVRMVREQIRIGATPYITRVLPYVDNRTAGLVLRF